MQVRRRQTSNNVNIGGGVVIIATDAIPKICSTSAVTVTGQRTENSSIHAVLFHNLLNSTRIEGEKDASRGDWRLDKRKKDVKFYLKCLDVDWYVQFGNRYGYKLTDEQRRVTDPSTIIRSSAVACRVVCISRGNGTDPFLDGDYDDELQDE